MTLTLLLGLLQAAAPQPAAWDTVAAVLKSAPAVTPEYRRYAFPRTDLSVKIGDVTVATGIAFGGWVGFVGPAEDAAMIGDLVLLPSELAAVSAALTSHGITMTAVHNHLARETPAVLYAHVFGTGPAVGLARAIDVALSATGAPRPVAVGALKPAELDTTVIFSTLGIRGRVSGPIANLSVQLVAVPIRVAGRDFPASLAAGSPINLQQVAPDRVVGTGDFSVPAAKAAAVAAALGRGGIAVTAIHTHYLASEPALVFMHFWADGNLAAVLKGLRAGIDAGR